MASKTETSLSDTVKALVEDGWHFKNAGSEGFYAHHEDGRYHRTSNVGDLVAAIQREQDEKEAATNAETEATVSSVFADKVDPSVTAAMEE